MAHISSISAAMFSDMAVATPAAELSQTALAALATAANFQALFASEIAAIGGTRAAGAFVRITDVREFPAMGAPANIVNVPTYGKKTSGQVQGQADAAAIELTLNYIPATWAKDVGNILGLMVNDGVQRVFRFTLAAVEPTGTTATKWASVAGGLGTVQNSQFYWVGKVEALQVTPGLTDASTATLTISAQTDLFGPFTI